MEPRDSPTLRRLAWERLWRILLAPPTEAEQARLERLRNDQPHEPDDQPERRDREN